MSSVSEKREIVQSQKESSFYFVEDVKTDDNNIAKSLIKTIRIDETNSFEIFLNTQSKLLSLNVIQNGDGGEYLAWISVDDEHKLSFNLYENRNWLIFNLDNLSSQIDGFDFETSKIFLFENTIYFDICEGTNRYLATVGLLDEEINIYSLGHGVGCSLFLNKKQRKILFSFLKPLQNRGDMNSVFVQNYDMDSQKINEPILVHISGENPSFSPEFISTQDDKLGLVWEKSYGNVFNSKSLYASYLNKEGKWSPPKPVYNTDYMILDFRLFDDESDGLTVLIHEYDIVKKEQYLVEFQVSKNERRVLHQFDENMIAFEKANGRYFLFLGQD